MKYVSFTLSIFIVIVIFLVAACGSAQVTTGDSNTGVTPSDNSADTTSVSDEQPGTTTPTTKTTTAAKTTSSSAGQPSAEVKELLGKYSSVKSVQYTMDGGSENTIVVSLKGDKFKKVVPRARYGLATYYDTVYVDRAARTAYTYCADRISCAAEHQGKALSLDFTQENLITPIDIITGVTSAEIVGSGVISERKTTTIEFTNSAGKKEQLWVDNYYGMPLEQRIYEGEGDNEAVAEKHTFTRPAFNGLKDADVTLPSSYAVN